MSATASSRHRTLQGARAKRSKLVGAAGQGAADSRASESNNLARNVAYRYAGFKCNSRPYGIIVLERHYVADAQALVRQRLLQAGGRLANLLNQTLVAH